MKEPSLQSESENELQVWKHFAWYLMAWQATGWFKCVEPFQQLGKSVPVAVCAVEEVAAFSACLSPSVLKYLQSLPVPYGGWGDNLG